MNASLNPRLASSLLCLALVLTACGSAPPAPPATPAEETPPPPSGADTPLPTPLPTETLPPTSTPSPTQTPTPLACWAEGGHLEEGEFDTDLLRQPLEFIVYLPPCYDQLPDAFYPTLYMIHGQSFNQDQWVNLGAVEITDALILLDEVVPYIMVFPRVIDWSEPPEGRFGEAMIRDLLPYIDETYRTIPHRDYRAVGGLSRGASWAVHFGLNNYDLFGAWGGHSLPVFYSDAPTVQEKLDAIPPEDMPRIYVDIADGDHSSIMRSAVWFVGQLEIRHIPHEFHVFPGNHNEEYWSAHTEEYLRFYAQEW